LEAVIYTTPLHTPAAPLRTVGFPFAGQMIAPAGYQNMVNRGNALFGGMLSSERIEAAVVAVAERQVWVAPL
jgi:hypothetical protein